MSDNDPRADDRKSPAPGPAEVWDPLDFWCSDGAPAFPDRPGGGADQPAGPSRPGQGPMAPRSAPARGPGGWPGEDYGYPGHVPPDGSFPDRPGRGQLEFTDPGAAGFREGPYPVLEEMSPPPDQPGPAGHLPEAPGGAAGPSGYLWEEFGGAPGTPGYAGRPGSREDMFRVAAADNNGWGPPEFLGAPPATNAPRQWPAQPRPIEPDPRWEPARPAARRFPVQRRYRGGVRPLHAIIAVVVAVLLIFGAVLLLTGGASHPGSADPAAMQAAAPAQAASTFPGFPGQQGSVSVTAADSAGGVQVAVGTADGRRSGGEAAAAPGRSRQARPLRSASQAG